MAIEEFPNRIFERYEHTLGEYGDPMTKKLIFPQCKRESDLGSWDSASDLEYFSKCL
jgi:hypothetical protein